MIVERDELEEDNKHGYPQVMAKRGSSCLYIQLIGQVNERRPGSMVFMLFTCLGYLDLLVAKKMGGGTSL